MSKYRYVSRCKVCGKIYPMGISRVCSKCGTTLGVESSILGNGKLRLTNNCERVIARKKLFKGWEVKEND